jgi:hypothetical protein
VRAHPRDRHVVTAVPQYERDLRHIFISIPSGDLQQTLRASDQSVSTTFLAHVYDELLASLPPYSEISIAVQAHDRRRVLPLIERLAQGRPFVLHVIDDAHTALDLWAQDLGEAFAIDGQPRFLVSGPVAPALAYDSRIAHDRAAVARAVFGRPRVVEADFVFEGGNLMFDRGPDGLRVLIGYNDLWLTVQSEAARGRQTTLAEVAARVSSRFGGAEVVQMGTDRQSPFLPHIDESFVLLANRTAVVTRLPGSRSPEARELAGYAAALDALGYRVLTIDSTQQDVEHYQASTNAVPFVDRDTGDRKIIFPVFPDEVEVNARQGGRLTRDVLRGKASQAWAVYASAGYRPIPVRDFAHVDGGATHCISNALD